MLAPNETILTTCKDIIEPWRLANCPDQPLELELRQIAWRVPTWISGGSVSAGVGDVMASLKSQGRRVPPEAIADLADRLTGALRAGGMLQGQLRANKMLG